MDLESVNNQRRYNRVNVKCCASVRGERSSVLSICENISEGGFFMRCLGKENVGSKIKFELELPERDLPLVAEGYVVWRNEDNPRDGGGVTFTRMLRSDREWLADFVLKKSSVCDGKGHC